MVKSQKIVMNFLSKNPLVTPPDFMKLPKPKDAFETEASSLEDETDIKKLLEMDKSRVEI